MMETSVTEQHDELAATAATVVQQPPVNVTSRRHSSSNDRTTPHVIRYTNEHACTWPQYARAARTIDRSTVRYSRPFNAVLSPPTNERTWTVRPVLRWSARSDHARLAHTGQLDRSDVAHLNRGMTEEGASQQSQTVLLGWMIARIFASLCVLISRIDSLSISLRRRRVFFT